MVRGVKGALLKRLDAVYAEAFAEATLSAIMSKGATAWQLASIAAPYMAGIVAINAAIPYAKGGIINSPTVALMGEAGSEAVIPLEGAEGRKALSQLRPLQVNFSGVFMGNEIEADAFTRTIYKRIQKIEAKDLK